MKLCELTSIYSLTYSCLVSIQIIYFGHNKCWRCDENMTTIIEIDKITFVDSCSCTVEEKIFLSLFQYSLQSDCILSKTLYDPNQTNPNAIQFCLDFYLMKIIIKLWSICFWNFINNYTYQKQFVSIYGCFGISNKKCAGQ